MILHVDPDVIGNGVGIQVHFGVTMCELECILQEIPDRGQKNVPVDVERKVALNITHSKRASTGLCLERGGYLDVGDEVREGNHLGARRHSRRHSNPGEGPIDEIAHANQGPVEQGSGRAARADVACLDGDYSKRRGVNEIAQFVREKSQPFIQRLDAIALHQRIALKSVFRDGIGDAIVETAVESPKLIYPNLRTTFKCQLRYRLAEVAVVVNDLIDRKSIFR